MRFLCAALLTTSGCSTMMELSKFRSNSSGGGDLDLLLLKLRSRLAAVGETREDTKVESSSSLGPRVENIVPSLLFSNNLSSKVLGGERDMARMRLLKLSFSCGER